MDDVVLNAPINSGTGLIFSSRGGERSRPFPTVICIIPIRSKSKGLKKQFNVNWKAAAVAHDKSIEKASSSGKIYFNQLANRCEKQIKLFVKNSIKLHNFT